MFSALRQVGVLGRIAAPRWGSQCARNTVGRMRVGNWLAACLMLSIFAPTFLASQACAQAPTSDLVVPPLDDRSPILFGGDDAIRWSKGSYDIWVLRGRCYVQQGATAAEAQQAVLWVKRGIEFDHERNTVIAYLEGDVRIVDGRADQGLEIRDRWWFGEFTSTVSLDVRTPQPREGEPPVLPQVFVNAQAYRDSLLKPGSRPVQRVQHVQPAQAVQVQPQASDIGLGGANGMNGQINPGGFASPPPEVLTPTAPSGRRLRAFSRSSVKVQVKWIPSPNGQEWVGLISPGVNLIIDGLEGAGTLDIATDRMVVWTSGMEAPDLSGNTEQGQDRPLEIYMEGNIVFREGARVIYADRMYYNVNTKTGTILDAEVLTPIMTYDGLARLKADVVRQTGDGFFEAESATLTTSRMADPRYRLQSQKLTFRDQSREVVNPVTRQPLLDATTGEPIVNNDRMATGTNNFIFMGPVPVFYWPVFAADMEDPRFLVRNVRFRNDKIFGTQLRTDFDMFQVLGWKDKPKNQDWIASLDWLSARGLGYGTTFRYSGDDLFTPGPYAGVLDAWAIRDYGLDYLGSDRQNLFPEKLYRWRIFERHRQQLPDNFQLTGEIGYISDRNFLEQYFELEWDTFKDQNTGIELKQLNDNRSWAISSDVYINAFQTNTAQLPRFDHFWLGESLLGDTLTYYEHSSAEYAALHILSTPENPAEIAKFKTLPWETDIYGGKANVEGRRLVTAQEIDMPFELGPVKVVPYALGQAGDWGEVLDYGDTQRLYGQAGVRAALPFWSVNPGIRNELFNVNGIAHKIVFDIDASFAEANRDLSAFPLYDQIDDDAQEHFRRRFAFNTFGGTTPPQFDERYYAVRSGLASNVSNPSAEIAEDLMAVRMGIRQRWQTKRGPAIRPRIVDWIVLDTEIVYYPDANRDNFGESFGLARYDFRWHIGERTTLLSNGGYDFFDQGQSTVSVGAQINRPTNGTLYVGYRSLNGPFDGQIAMASFAYRLSPKWVGTASISYDFTSSGSLGNAFSIARIGESFITSLSFNADVLKDNNTVMFSIEPRFIPGFASRSTRGLMVPTPGAYGLE